MKVHLVSFNWIIWNIWIDFVIINGLLLICFLSVWFGVIFVRSGYYRDGIFRFNISLPKDFPNTTDAPVSKYYLSLEINHLIALNERFMDAKLPPIGLTTNFDSFAHHSQTVIFQSELCHPLICPFTGILNIGDAFTVWNPSEHHLWQLLKYIQFIFAHPIACLSNESIKVSNAEIADLLRNQKHTEFETKVKECVRISKDKIYDAPPTEDKHYITFSMFDEELHRSTLENLKSKGGIVSSSPPPIGLSWVNEGEFKALRK